MSPRKAVFFDLDGTLLDHFAAIHRAHSHTRRHFGLPAPTMQEVHRAVGAGVDVAISRIFAGHDELLAQAIPVYKTYWDKNMLDGVELLPGSRELLEALNAAGVRCAVLTNKHGPSSRIVCGHLGITPLLAGIFGATDTPWLKPQAEFTAHALAAIGCDAAAACLIGDSIYDVQTGLNAGFPCHCVTTGTHGEAELRAAGASGVWPDMFAVGRNVFGLWK
ncbi:HAD family hydrolase [Termitidicoccus mucosus]|uniref:phosphoglycolate phosphatase n=1 Tax=Termitidicoccus mucosus TaxID=1184151 RepID=A0A178II25_9BACT|nr:haloacid dehalogenase [Opitutaceae bacterium TSB47]